MFGLSKEEIVKKDILIHNWVKFLSLTGYRLLSRPHVENISYLLRLKKENVIFLYTGLHKSLWETTGVLASIYLHGLPIPFTGMGDNLIKGKFFQRLATKAGVFLVKRPTTRKEVIESSKKLKQYITYYIANGKDVVMYPEGTRRNVPDMGKYGKFFPTAFEAVLEYEKNKEKLLAEYKELTPHNVYIVPFNTDYSQIREDYELVGKTGAKPLTLKVFDSFKMLKHVGDLYISFGEPIKLADHLDKSRKELAIYTRERCLDLVKILPINIVAQAILDAFEGEEIKTDKILDNIDKNIKKITPFKERFRGFEPGENPKDILNLVTSYKKNFKNIDSAHLPIYRLYANYINHYWEELRGRR